MFLCRRVEETILSAIKLRTCRGKCCLYIQPKPITNNLTRASVHYYLQNIFVFMINICLDILIPESQIWKAVLYIVSLNTSPHLLLTRKVTSQWHNSLSNLCFICKIYCIYVKQTIILLSQFRKTYKFISLNEVVLL